ncbi:MAG TPA: hypothetical protein VFU21_19780 [Kofleriaceae bacterium]|nr:hypothetical protein [Kofleriaceae bacterium]
MSRTAAARLAVLAVLSAACAAGGDPSDRGDAAPAGPPFRSALIGNPDPPARPFVLDLASPGAEPRRQLRYRVAPGTRERTRIAITNELEVFIAGRRVERSAPPTMEMAFEVEAAARPGGYRCTAWITDTASSDWERMAPGAGAELRQALEKLRGHQISFEVDERGHPVSHEVALPGSLDTYRGEALQILQALDGSVVPLPAEPVGVGAVWTTADAETGRSNLPGTVVFTYTLVAMRGDRIELSMQLGLPQEPGPLQLTGRQLSTFSGASTSGTGRVTLDLSRLMSDSDGTFEIDLEGRAFRGGEELPFRVHQKVHHQLDSR